MHAMHACTHTVQNNVRYMLYAGMWGTGYMQVWVVQVICRYVRYRIYAGMWGTGYMQVCEVQDTCRCEEQVKGGFHTVCINWYVRLRLRLRFEWQIHPREDLIKNARRSYLLEIISVSNTLIVVYMDVLKHN